MCFCSWVKKRVPIILTWEKPGIQKHRFIPGKICICLYSKSCFQPLSRVAVGNDTETSLSLCPTPLHSFTYWLCCLSNPWNLCDASYWPRKTMWSYQHCYPFRIYHYFMHMNYLYPGYCVCLSPHNVPLHSLFPRLPEVSWIVQFFCFFF